MRLLPDWKTAWEVLVEALLSSPQEELITERVQDTCKLSLSEKKGVFFTGMFTKPLELGH